MHSTSEPDVCPTGSAQISISAFGCRIHAEAPCPQAQALLDRYLFPSLPRTKCADTPDLSLSIAQVPEGYEFLADDSVIAAAHEPSRLIPEIISVADDAIIRRMTGLRAVHAGAVLWRGKVILLPGATHAGKSHLVAELLRRGATYFSDEYALIDRDGQVHPYPRPLLLRDESGEQEPTLPAEFDACTGSSPAPVGSIFYLRYSPESPWNVMPISQSESLLMLLRNTPHVLADSPDMIATFHRAITEARSYCGSRPESSEAADKVLQLAGS